MIGPGGQQGPDVPAVRDAAGGGRARAAGALRGRGLQVRCQVMEDQDEMMMVQRRSEHSQ